MISGRADHVGMLIIDLKLGGKIGGLELANFVPQSYPEISLL
jgi:hypothetical protein